MQLLYATIKEWKNFVSLTKSSEKQANIMSFKVLLEVHKIITRLDPQEINDVIQPIFTKIELFRKYEKDEEFFMESEKF